MQLRAGTLIDTILHDAYRTQATARAFWRISDQLLLADGTRYVDGRTAQGGDIIPQHDRELEIDHQLRKDLTLVEGYVRQIADHYCSHVLRRPPTVVDVEHVSYEALVSDADGWGTGLEALLGKVLRQAFVEQASYLMPDSTLDRAPESAAEDGRYVLRQVSPDSVLWWSDLPNGQPQEALITAATVAGTPILLHLTKDVITRATYDVDKRLILDVEDTIPHRFGACPLVRVTAPPIIPPVADAQRRLAWLASLLAMEETDATITQLVIRGANPKAVEKMIKGSRTAWVFEDAAAAVDTFGADPNQAQSLRQSITDTRDGLYRSAKVQPVQAQGMPESGVARAYRFVDADAELAALAGSLETARNRAVGMWAKASGVESPPVATYPDSFAPVDERGVIDRLLAVESSGLPDAWKAAERRRAGTILYPDDEDVAATADMVDDGSGADGLT